MINPEVSLAVAEAMKLGYARGILNGRCIYKDGVHSNDPITFDYTTDDALGKMLIWLHRGVDEHGSKGMRITMMDMAMCLFDDDPHSAVADAIIKLSDS